MILVCGATGNTGRATVDALLDRGAPVRAMSRGDHDWPAGVEGVRGDMNADAFGPEIVDGVEAAYLLSGYDGQVALLAALKAAGAQRVTLLSSSSAPSGALDNAVAKYHLESEAAVRESGLAWTFLRPNTFMSNALNWRGELTQGDVVHGPFGDVPVALNDPADIAAIASLALTTGDLDDQVLRISGPEALTPGEQVRILGEALDRDLEFVGWDDDEARAQMSATMPAEYVDAFFAFYRGGLIDESTVHTTVQDILGTPPRSFSNWCDRHADQF